MNKEHWKNFYKKNQVSNKPSSFAIFSLPYIQEIHSSVVDIGCGNGRDVNFFRDNSIDVIGIDSAFGIDVETFIKKNKSPNIVYTRFFWHAITRDIQLRILKWTKNYIFIEARTEDDVNTHKEFEEHERNYINVSRLVKDLKDNGFEIVYLTEGKGMSIYKSENPYLIRVIAKKI